MSEVKLEIEKVTGIRTHQQRLLFAGKELESSGNICVDALRMGRPELQLQMLSNEEQGRQQAIERLRQGAKLKNLEDVHKADPEVVLFAVKHVNPSELQHAAVSVRGDREFLLKAMELNTICRYYASDELWHDFFFIQAIVQADGLLLGSSLVPSKWR